jgi:hypothetical protein
MADDALLPDITETILEPRTTRLQLGPPDVFPQLFTFTGEDVLELAVWSSVASVRVTLQGRSLDSRGVVQPFTTDLAPTSNRVINTKIHTIARGTLLNLVAFCSSGSPLLGQVYVRVSVLRGAGPASTRLGVLIGGLITATQHLGFPGSPIRSAFESEPVNRIIVGTTPAASTTSSEAVPTGARWELMAYRILFTEGVGGAAVPCAVVLSDGSNVIARCLGGSSGAASTTSDYNFAKFFQARTSPVSSGVALNDPLPENRLPAGGTILFGSTSVLGFPWSLSAPVFNVREWLEVP